MAKVQPSGSGNSKGSWFSFGVTVKASSEEVALLSEAIGQIRESKEYQDYLNGKRDTEANLARFCLEYASEGVGQ